MIGPQYHAGQLNIPIAGSPDALPIALALHNWNLAVPEPATEAEVKLSKLASELTPTTPELVIQGSETITLLAHALEQHRVATTDLVFLAHMHNGGIISEYPARDLSVDPELYHAWILAQRAGDLGGEILGLLKDSCTDNG